MNISISAYDHHFGYRPYDYMQRAGWNNVSVAFKAAEFSSLAANDWHDYLLCVKEALDARGMRCVQTHLPYYYLLRDSGDIDEETQNVIERGLIMSAKLGAKWSVFHCRTATERGADVDIAFIDNLIELRRLLCIAREHNIGIAVENLPVFSHVPYHLFSSDYREIIRLVDELDDPLIGICWDFGHAHMSRVDQPTALREVGSRLKATHIHNNYGSSDSHMPASIGSVKWEEMMSVLAEIGYKNSLSLEVNYPKERFAESYFLHNYHCAVELARMFNESRTHK